MRDPIKPFPTYKWRWLSVQPSEGHLDAPVFLGVLRALWKNEGTTKIVIPLAGVRTNVDDIAMAIHDTRVGTLNVTSWPDCAPGANDSRLAREFLLFLRNFEICRVDGSAESNEEKYCLDQLLSREIASENGNTFLENPAIVDQALLESRLSEIPAIIERKRVIASVVQRSGQAIFGIAFWKRRRANVF